jgi:hypothetical protein
MRIVREVAGWRVRWVLAGVALALLPSAVVAQSTGSGSGAPPPPAAVEPAPPPGITVVPGAPAPAQQAPAQGRGCPYRPGPLELIA